MYFGVYYIHCDNCIFIKFCRRRRRPRRLRYGCRHQQFLLFFIQTLNSSYDFFSSFMNFSTVLGYSEFGFDVQKINGHKVSDFPYYLCRSTTHR